MYIWKTYEDTRLRQSTPSQEERPIKISFLWSLEGISPKENLISDLVL